MNIIKSILKTIVISSLIFYFLYAQLANHLYEGLALLSQISYPRFFILLILCGIPYILGGITLTLLSRNFHPLKFHKGIQASFLSMFVENTIGGPFAKAVPLLMLRKQNFKIQESLCVVGYDFLNFQIPVVFFSFMPFFLGNNYFFTTYPLEVVPALLGAFVDFGPIIILILLFSSSPLQRFLSYIYHTLYQRFHHLKSKQRLEKVKASVLLFQIEKSMLIRHTKLFIQVFLLNFLRLTLRNFLPLIAMWSLRIPIASEQIIYLWLGSIFLELIMSLVPVAGKHGVAESCFILVYAPMIHGINAFGAMLVWRFSFYYINTFLGALMLIITNDLSLKEIFHMRKES